MKLYNTLTRTVEVFVPKGKRKCEGCGEVIDEAVASIESIAI